MKMKSKLLVERKLQSTDIYLLISSRPVRKCLVSPAVVGTVYNFISASCCVRICLVSGVIVMALVCHSTSLNFTKVGQIKIQRIWLFALVTREYWIVIYPADILNIYLIDKAKWLDKPTSRSSSCTSGCSGYTSRCTSRCTSGCSCGSSSPCCSSSACSPTSWTSSSF